jgi:hypothetical protein
MSQFVKVTDTQGNTVFLNPRQVISVTQSGQTVDILLPSRTVVTIETTVDKIVDQLSVVLS